MKFWATQETIDEIVQKRANYMKEHAELICKPVPHSVDDTIYIAKLQQIIDTLTEIISITIIIK